MASLKDARKGKAAVLSDHATHISVVCLYFLIACLGKSRTFSIWDLQANRFSANPYITPQSTFSLLPASCNYGAQLTIAADVSITVYQSHLDSSVKKITNVVHEAAIDKVARSEEH